MQRSRLSLSLSSSFPQIARTRMPIQFRCQHCRQLLGISRSKAGSIVDCPACGRSLRVPMMDGVAAKHEPVQHGSDAGFRSALEELSSFPDASGSQASKSTIGVVVTTPQAARRDRVELPVTRVRRRGTIPPGDAERESPAAGDQGRDSIRIVPLTATATAASGLGSSPEEILQELADLSPAEDWEPRIIPELVEPELIDEPVALSAETTADAVPRLTEQQPRPAFELPDHLSSALEELAGTVAPAETRALIPVTRTVNRLLWGAATAALFICGAVAGFLLGQSRENSHPESSSSAVNNGSTPVPGNAAQTAASVQPGTVPPVSGIVQYDTGSGQFEPDAGALILLLPITNTCNLRLDARPLREAAADSAKEAVEAALRVLGATVSRAADDGTFSVPRHRSGEMRLLVISRHSSRPDSEPVAPLLIEQLAQWFESPTHITGRLSVKQAIILPVSVTDNSAAGRIEITM